VLEFFRRLFSAEGFMPHGHCYLWQPGVLWLHLISDALVAVAYTSIPFTLLYIVRKRRDLPFNWMVLCFGTFIIACGATHAMEIWTIWTPTYWLAGMIKAVTAVASVATAILLIKLVPRAVALPTAAELSRAHADLRLAHAELETRVAERTAELTRKNHELELSEARFRRLTESGIVGVMFSSLDGKVVEANDAFLRIVGYPREDLVAGLINTKTFTIPERTAARAAAVEELLTTGRTLPWESMIIRKDGSRIPTLTAVTMLDPPNTMALVLDLTEQKRAEAAIVALRAQHENDARFRELLEAAPEAMVITGPNDNIVLVNAQAELLFGYPRAELLLAPFSKLVDATGGIRKDGSHFLVEISASPIKIDDSTLTSRTIRDITVRKRIEEDLMRARDAAEVASRELEAFSYSVAHDLRAPLRGINGYAVLLTEDLGDKLAPASRLHLERISSGATRMGELIDALLRLSRLSRAELVNELVDVTRLAREVFARLEAQDPDRHVTLTVEDGLATRGDPELIALVLENLLGNAWKFTAQRAQATIELGVDKAGYFIRDNGAGFDMAYAKKLFMPFQRLHTATAFSGTGIGLATVQRIVHRHGGTVWAEGAVGKGATFHFTLGPA
jgi:PAS domain S-box-containing protein